MATITINTTRGIEKEAPQDNGRIKITVHCEDGADATYTGDTDLIIIHDGKVIREVTADQIHSARLIKMPLRGGWKMEVVYSG